VSGLQHVTTRGEPLRIVVAVDGSAPANRAVGHALLLVTGRPGSEIVLVNAQNQQTLDISDISAVMTVEVDRRLAARQSRIPLPAETIDRVAREIGAHQIVPGTRSLCSLGNLFLGSVATKVVRLAQIPVTLVK
jgi:nucleotide-binding universal stress UspA family protein